MPEAKKTTIIGEVPKQIFGTFLDELGKTDVPEETVKRLRVAILEGALTDNSIKTALSSEKEK